MKKKIVVLAVAVAMFGGAVGAYFLHDYREHKPLILSCRIAESAAPSQAGHQFILRFEASPAGWSVGPADRPPDFWNFEKQRWEATSVSFESDDTRFAWTEIADVYSSITEINRKTGEYSTIRAKGIPFTASNGKKFLPNAVIDEKGVCNKSEEPSRTVVEQLF